MKSGSLIVVVGFLGAAGYFGYDYYREDQAKKKAKAEAAEALRAREARANDPNFGTDPTRDKHAAAVVMPDVRGMTPQAAKDTLAKAGFKLDKFKALDDVECMYAHEKDMKPKGTVCAQEPEPGSHVQPSVRIEVTLEEDTYQEGAIGSPSAWKRMPNLVGMTETAAKSALRAAGFTEEEFDIDTEEGCGTVGLVCRTNPDGEQRKVRGRKGGIFIGD